MTLRLSAPKFMHPGYLPCLTLDLSLLGMFLPFSELHPTIIGRRGPSASEGWEE